MERLGKPRHGRGGRRLSEREVSESNPAVLSWNCFTGILRLRSVSLHSAQNDTNMRRGLR